MGCILGRHRHPYRDLKIKMPRESSSSGSRADIAKRYMSLDRTGSAIQVLYVWIDGSGQTLRCKTKTVYEEPRQPGDLPVWNFDGSSTGQADGGNSDVYLHPVALFADPFRGLPNKIALCETYTHDGTPCSTNKRKSCQEVMEKRKVKNCSLGLE